MSHLSKLPLARNFPQGEKATLYTGSLCLLIMLVNVNILKPVTMPIGDIINTFLIGMFIIFMANLVNVWTQVPFSTSHKRTVESKLAEASTSK